MACSKFDYAKYFDINKIDLVGICKIETCNVKSVKFAESSKTNLKKHIAKNQIKQICSVRRNSTLYGHVHKYEASFGTFQKTAKSDFLL